MGLVLLYFFSGDEQLCVKFSAIIDIHSITYIITTDGQRQLHIPRFRETWEII